MKERCHSSVAFAMLTLNNHVAMVHERRIPRTFPVAFATLTLNNHVAMVHERKIPRTFPMEVYHAGVTFTMITFATVHEGKMSFKCGICNANFE